MILRRKRFRLPPISTLLAYPIYAFLIMPTVIVVPMSFSSGNELVFPPRSLDLGLYRKLLDPSSGWLDASLRSFKIASLTAIIALCLGVPAAYGLARARFPGKSALGFSMLSPIFAPTIVLALGLYLYFIKLGIAGSVLGLVFAHTLLVTPFVIVTVGSAILQLDEGIEHAGAVMGAGPIRIFFQIVVPGLRSSLLAGGLFAFLMSFDEVVVAWFVGTNSDPTLPVKMYSSIQWEVSPVLAAISTILVLLTVMVCLVAAMTQPPQVES
jgi:putative spermidine/putrescine transport system permease protein